MDRRSFLKGLVATAAGVLIPASVAAEPERRIWALNRSVLVRPVPWSKEPFMELTWDGMQNGLRVYAVVVNNPNGTVDRIPMEPTGDGTYVAHFRGQLDPMQPYRYSVAAL